MNRLISSLSALCALTWAVFLGCSGGSGGDVAGSGSSLGNGRVVGIALLPDGSATQATVRLRRVDYVTSLPSMAKSAAIIGADAMTDDNGRFEITGIEPGSYRIEVADNISSSILLACTLSVGDEADFDTVTMKPFAAINGVIDTAGYTGQQLYVQVEGLDRLVSVNGDGSFAISDLPAGTHTIHVVEAGQTTPVAIASGITVVSGGAENIQPLPGWRYSKRLYLNTAATGANVMENVTDFPLLVRLDATNFEFTQAGDSGQDIRFTKTDGSLLPFEIEQWDVINRQAAIWVRMDTVYGNSDRQFIVMNWGSAGASSASVPGMVFDTANGFDAVWHLSGNAPTSDATTAAHTLTDGGTTPTNGSIGFGRYFDNLDSMTAPDSPDLNPASFSVSCWFARDGVQVGLAKLLCKGSSVFPHQSYTLDLRQSSVAAFQTAHTDSWFKRDSTGQVIADQTWYLLCGTYNAVTGTQILYLNGEIVDSSTYVVPIQWYSQDHWSVYLGSQYNTIPSPLFKGMIDEVRIEGVARTSAWTKLCYFNQRDNSTFVKF